MTMSQEHPQYLLHDESTLAMIRALLIEKFQIDPELATPTARLSEIAVDSLMLVELGIDITDRTGVQIDEAEVPKLTLGQLAAMVAAQRSRE